MSNQGKNSLEYYILHELKEIEKRVSPQTTSRYEFPSSFTKVNSLISFIAAVLQQLPESVFLLQPISLDYIL